MARDGQEWRDLLKRYLDTGSSLSKMSRRELEQFLREVVTAGESGREHVEDAFEELRVRGRRGVDQLGDFVRAEIRRELENRAARQRAEFADLVGRGMHMFGSLISNWSAGRTNPKNGGSHAPASRDTPWTSPDSEPPVKAAPAKKAGAKKVAAKKAPAKKTAAQKVPAKKTAGKSVAAKKTAVKKTAAKKVAAKEASPTDSPTLDES